MTVQGIFNQLRKKNRGNINGKRDNTVEIKTLLRFLNGIEITEFATVTEIIELIEKYYDDDENFARCGNGKLLMFLLNQEITEYEFFEFLALLALKLEQPRRIGRGYETITDRVTRFIEEKLIIGMTKIGKSQSIMLTSELTF